MRWSRARGLAFAALGAFGAASHWMRMLEPAPRARVAALLSPWLGVALAVVAAAAARARARAARAVALVAALGLALALLAGGVARRALRPHDWDELVVGIGARRRARCPARACPTAALDA